MSTRALSAIVRVRILASRRSFLVGSLAAVAALAGAIVLEGPLKWIAVLVGSLVLMATTVLAPVTSLGMEKMFGHLEVDRTLPLPLRFLASARLIAAALFALPLVPLLIAFGVAVASTAPMVRVSVIAVALAVALLAYWSVLWTSYALVARFSMQRLVWLPGIVWLVAVLIPSSVFDAIRTTAEAFLTQLGAQSAPPVASLALALLVAAGVAAVAFAGATALLTNALARFRHDPAAMNGLPATAPKRELIALGRGPVLAVMRLRLRLATEQFQREMMMIGVLLVVILADVGDISSLARQYLPILGGLITASVSLQLITGRALGALESMQQLPHPRRLIGLGHLLAVMVMATPAMVIITLSRATEGIEPDATSMAVRWLLLVAVGSLLAGFTVWATARRLAISLAALIATPIALIWLGAASSLPARAWVRDLARTLLDAGPTSTVLASFALALVALAVANEMFAWGLSTH